MGTIVTTSHQSGPAAKAAAEFAAGFLHVPLVARNRQSLKQLREEHAADNIIVAFADEYKLMSPRGEYSFHPSMSVPRIKALRQGQPDHMVQAMRLNPGDSVLDCTLGLGADAIVAAYVTGLQGRVVGLESSRELAFLVSHGLKHYRTDSAGLQQAMQRIEVIAENHDRFLEGLPANSFDIVYFDPMFRYPRKKSSSMHPLRGIVNDQPVQRRTVELALKVARKRVVLKENYFSTEFARLGFSEIAGGRYSPVAFGIIDSREAPV